MTISGQGPDDFDYADYPVNLLVVVISYALIFLCLIMARLMGGHVSKGWYYLALGASLNALGYSFYSALYIIGAYFQGHYLDAISIMALNAVSFGAYYQYKKHMELMSSLM